MTQTLALLSEAPHLPGRKTSKYEVPTTYVPITKSAVNGFKLELLRVMI